MADHFVDRLGFTLDSVRAEVTGQQRPGIVRAEQVQGDQAGSVVGDQAGQLVAAGDHDQAAGSGQQQRSDLLDIAGVVQHYQHAPAGQQAAIQPRLGLQAGGNLVGGDSEGVEEPTQRLRRGQRGVGGVKTTQVHIQLPLGEPVCRLVSPMHRQGGLANPGATVDRGDHHRAPTDRVGVVEQGSELTEFAGAAHKMRGMGGQLVRHRPRGCSMGSWRGCGHCFGSAQSRGEGGVGGQDLLVQSVQVGARVEAELVGQAGPQLLVVLDGVGLATTLVQGEHQLAGHPFVQRMRRSPGGQLARQPAVLAPAQQPVGAVQLHREPLPLQTGPQRVEPRGVQPGERLPPPQTQRLLKQRERLVLLGSGPALGHQMMKPVQVHRQRIDDQHIPPALADNVDLRDRAQGLA